ncbi:MAG: LacI family DNA-binding transcriptional regulator [Candidatus Cohnella colombiensis]|uniref:LacI family DNA-binding transcriptional regulator n=1 Tax=Candidatus Cohnella colombiensis TaxID=3121368 RepID=A0AA95F0I2_9BACL|nr:MAG: LacI family DNA-binding transcriptional regulator [Cohnella sp.]
MTMQQIAEQVGVSKFAVSQALSGKPGVAEDTRTKIVQTANELGYFWKTKIIKRSPSTGLEINGNRAQDAAKSTVIILMPNVRFQSRESLFWGRIIDGVSAALAEKEIGVMMITENYSERSLKSINPNGVLGLIGIGYIATNLLLEIRQMGIPFVLIDHEDPMIPSDTVFMNNYDCMRQITSLVLQAGHKDVRFIGGPRYSRSFHDRWLGFRIMMEENGLSVPNPEEDPLLQLELEENEYIVVRRELDLLIAQNKLPTVFVCANDFLAYLVMERLIERGISIPDTVSITGFDHTDETNDPKLPTLSTIHVPNKRMGKRAVEMLYTRVNDPDRPFEKTLINGNFMLRNSFKKI